MEVRGNGIEVLDVLVQVLGDLHRAALDPGLGVPGHPARVVERVDE